MPSTTVPADVALLHAENLTRSFGARRAVDGVSFALAKGDCLVVFGPNGAGKTTLLRMLAGLLRPSTGGVTLGGAALTGRPAARARVGIISHSSMLYEALTPRENVAFAAGLYGLKRASRRVEEALAAMEMLERADAPVRSLSRGMQQRVSIARATVHNPQLVVADEPYNGLDDDGARALTALLHGLRATGTTVVLVTHNIAEGLAVSSHAALMRGGRFAHFGDSASFNPRSYAPTPRTGAVANG